MQKLSLLCWKLWKMHSNDYYQLFSGVPLLTLIRPGPAEASKHWVCPLAHKPNFSGQNLIFTKRGSKYWVCPGTPCTPTSADPVISYKTKNSFEYPNHNFNNPQQGCWQSVTRNCQSLTKVLRIPNDNFDHPKTQVLQSLRIILTILSHNSENYKCQINP